MSSAGNPIQSQRHVNSKMPLTEQNLTKASWIGLDKYASIILSIVGTKQHLRIILAL